MTLINTIFDAYINANIVLILVFGVWSLARMLLKPLGIVHAYTTQLKLLNGAFLAVAVSQLFVIFFSLLINYNFLAPEFAVNLSDMVVAQYLQGNFEMNAAALEEYLGLRTRLNSELLGLTGTTSLIVMGIIGTGVIIFSVKLGINILALRNIINHSHHWRRFGNLQLLVSDTISVPFSTRSLTKRYIVIPSSIVTDAQNLRMILGHEFQHLRQYDLEWEIALEILKPLFFWNPAYYLWKQQVEQLRELSCDQQVLARRRYNAGEYCACLLQVCQNSLNKNRLFSIAVPKVTLVQTDNSRLGRNSVLFLRQRVISLLNGQTEKYPRLIFLSLMIPLLVAVALSVLAIQKPNDWSQDRIMLSTIVNLERLAESNGSVEPFSR